MRYITKADDYISAVSFGCDIECEDGYCQEYTGGVPTGYTSLDAWYAAEGEKLYRWKIVNGQLTLDVEAVPPAQDKPPYAPEGYGLGESSGQLVYDCNAAVLSGWYQLDEYAMNAPDAAGHLMRVSACAGSIYQEVFAEGSTVTRWCKNGAWDAWEWVNPPFHLGVEYRTTERWAGHVVYARLYDAGTAENGAKTLDYSFGATHMIRSEGMVLNGGFIETMPVFHQRSFDGTYSTYIQSCGPGRLVIVSNSGNAGNQVYVKMFYIKD